MLKGDIWGTFFAFPRLTISTSMDANKLPCSATIRVSAWIFLWDSLHALISEGWCSFYHLRVLQWAAMDLVRWPEAMKGSFWVFIL